MQSHALPWLVALAAMATPCVAGAGADVDVQRLKKLLRLPTLQIRISVAFGMEGPRIPELPSMEPDPDAEIARGMSELKGGPGDAAVYGFLARQHWGAGRDAKASGYWTKAVELYRARLAAAPDDAALQREAAPVFLRAGHAEEAERALRRVVALCPKESADWSALADHLATSVYCALSGTRFDGTIDLLEMVSQPATEHSPELSEAASAAARARLEEARACADQAVKTDPGSRAAAMVRWRLRMTALIWKCRGGEPAMEEVAGTFEEAARVFGAIAAEHPGDAEAQVGAAVFRDMFTAATALYRPSAAPESGGRVERALDLFGKLSDESTRRLEALGEGKDAIAAASALEAAAYARLTSSKFDKAEADARRAFDLDPRRDNAWKILIGCLVDRNGLEEMEALSRRSIAAQDSSFKRLILGKVLFLRGDAAGAEEETRAALKLDPRRLEAHLAAAVLILRRARSPAEFEEAGIHLARAKETLAVRTRLGTATDANNAECLLIEAIHRGLAGDPSGAAECARRLRDLDPEAKAPKEILEALGQ